MRMTLREAIEKGLVFPAARLAEKDDPAGPDGAAVFTLRVGIVSEPNRRDHWAARYKRAQQQKRAAYVGVLTHAAPLRNRIRAGEDVRLMVTLVRLLTGRQRPFDSDNLAAGFKAVRDGLAAAFGIDDGSSRFEWRYAQEPAADGKAGVRVIIAPVDFDRAA